MSVDEEQYSSLKEFELISLGLCFESKDDTSPSCLTHIKCIATQMYMYVYNIYLVLVPKIARLILVILYVLHCGF